MSICLVKQNDGTWVEKINVFYSTFTNVFLLFLSRFFTFLNVFLIFFSGTFFYIYDFNTRSLIFPYYLRRRLFNPLAPSVLLKGRCEKLDAKNAIQYSNEKKCLISVTRGP